MEWRERKEGEEILLSSEGSGDLTVKRQKKVGNMWGMGKEKEKDIFVPSSRA